MLEIFLHTMYILDFASPFYTIQYTNILTLIPLPEIGLGKTGPATASATGVAGSKAGQPAGAAGSGNVVLYGDSEVGIWFCLWLKVESALKWFLLFLQELNRVVVLTMARALQVNGLDQQSVTWVKDTLNGIMQKTPHR